MCGFIAGVVVLLFVFISTGNFLQQNPEAWWVVFLLIGAVVAVWFWLRWIKIENNRTYLLRIADDPNAVRSSFVNTRALALASKAVMLE